MPAPLIEQAAADGIVGSAIGWIVTLLGGLIGLIWRKHNAEIHEIKKALARKLDAELFDKTEDRLRTGIIDLHKKVEEATSDLYHKIDENERSATNRHIELLNAMRERRRDQ
jgi:hypothetical protein